MHPTFHLSIGVKSIEDSVAFFTHELKAKVLHRDPSGYVNIDLYGSQITLKHNETITPNLPDFHFGVNLSLDEFNTIATELLNRKSKYIAVEPEVWDAGTPMERKKMYLKCPTGYLVELKGYK